jgi:hypothetical protein
VASKKPPQDPPNEKDTTNDEILQEEIEEKLTKFDFLSRREG